MTQMDTVTAQVMMEQQLPELWRDLMGDLDGDEEASGLGLELQMCWGALRAIGSAILEPNATLWTQAVQETVSCLNLVQDTYGKLAVDPADAGFAGRFQEHFELETLGLEEPGGEFLFCDPYTMLVYGSCTILEKRILGLGKALAYAIEAGDREMLLHEVASRGYAILRAMEQVTIGVLEQLPLDTSSRSMIPGFRTGLKDLLDWREVLKKLEELPSDQSVQHALETLWQGPAAGALTASERKEILKYQELSLADLGGLLARIEAKPLVERAILN
jgi:hypothetical protein